MFWETSSTPLGTGAVRSWVSKSSEVTETSKQRSWHARPRGSDGRSGRLPVRRLLHRDRRTPRGLEWVNFPRSLLARTKSLARRARHVLFRHSHQPKTLD